MDLPELLDAAKRRKGSLKDIAADLGMHPNRLSDWRAGRLKPSASEIAYLAECAGLPVLETVADIESQLDSQHAGIWKRALGNLRAAGVAATVTLGLAIYSTTPNEADAAVKNFVTSTPAQPAPAQGNGVGTVRIMSTKIGIDTVRGL